MGSNKYGITRPMLYFSKTGITNTASPNIGKISLAHSGWIMAIHFKNISGTQMSLPIRMKINSSSGAWLYNAATTIGDITFDFETNSFSTNDYGIQALVSINEYSWNPLYGQNLADDSAIIFYRWIVSGTNIPQLEVQVDIGNITRFTPTVLSTKTVTNGKVYHIYTLWDGTGIKFTDPY